MKAMPIAIFMALFLAGCAVAPVGGGGGGGGGGVVNVRPAYPRPGPGYVWQNHPRQGWGWHHPNYGWHRGWR
jgi:hypothetical protein